MKMKPAADSHGHAAGKSGQELGLQNELALLNCIKTQGWIREYEAAFITGMSLYMVGVVSRRLANNGQIFREQCKNRKSDKTKRQKRNRLEIFDGNTGFFLRLTAIGADRVGGKSGKDISIPATWRHHAMAIQTLHFLASKFKCKFETEACFRHQPQSNKIPDGRLVSENTEYYFEQENTRKSGDYLQKQTAHITNMASKGITCFVAYPYPESIANGIDHETRHTNSIRHNWGSPAAPLINFVRCTFKTLIDFQNMHVNSFEIINLPSMFETADSKKTRPGITDQVKGFKWEMSESSDSEGSRQINAVLRHNGENLFEGIFIEGISFDDTHKLSKHGYIQLEAAADELTFAEFVRNQQKEIENAEQGMINLSELYVQHLAGKLN